MIKHCTVIAHKGKDIAPGLLVASLLAGCAYLVSLYSPLPVMLLCIFFGMIWNMKAPKSSLFLDGVDFTARSVLRFGVICMGARIAFDDFRALGTEMLDFVILVTIFIILFGLLCSKLLKIDKDLGILISIGTAICGASAVLALSALMPRSKSLDESTVSAVIAVTMMGTVMMVLYALVSGVLGLNQSQLGVMVGGTIHDVSQAVGAGYSISQEAGDNALLVKLLRVFLLVPLLVIFSFSYHRYEHAGQSLFKSFPWFVLGFVALIYANSEALLSAKALSIVQSFGKGFLMAALTAVGMKTSLLSLKSVGKQAAFLVCLETAMLFCLYYMFIVFGP